MKQATKFLLSTIAALALTACGTKIVKPADEGAEPAKAAMTLSELRPLLQERSTARWRFLIQRAAAKAYDYLTPGYRATRTREDYAKLMNERPVKWKDVAFIDAECDEPQLCLVRLNITYEIDMPVQMVGKVESIDVQNEKWIQVEGEWFHLPDVQKDLR